MLVPLVSRFVIITINVNNDANTNVSSSKKGHRSSHCSHVDRPLFEIRKKGRPVTQCSYCRDLRKTKQVHVKCACIDKKGNTNIS
jgi:hypothetical protein